MSALAMARESKSSAAAKAGGNVAGGLRINSPDDAYEREADRMADEVVASPAREAAWSLSRVTMGSGSMPSAVDAAKQAGRSGLIPVAQAASRFAAAKQRSLTGGHSASALRFRVPTGADMTKLWNSHTLSEDVFKDRVKTALKRMWTELPLDPRDSTPEQLTARIFPSPGNFDQAAFESIVSMTNQGDVYQSVAEAETKIHADEKPRFLKAIDASVETIGLAKENDKEMTKVFGTKKNTAKANYTKAQSALKKLKGKLDKNVSTDYNADDRETGLGGWADFGSQTAHFEPDVVKVANVEESEATIIHESSHLSNKTVDDKGYYGNPTYASAPEEVKVTNAAHYEEVPRRLLLHSIYRDKDHPGEFLTFVPGQSAGGGEVTFEQKARGEAKEYLRKAWDAAVDVDQLVRGVRKGEVVSGKNGLGKDWAKLMEISKVMGLTLHEQTGGHLEVNPLDMVLVEGVPHGVTQLDGALRQTKVLYPVGMVHVPRSEQAGTGEEEHDAPPGQRRELLDPETVGKMMVEETAKRATGHLSSTPENDMKVLQWLVDHYRQVL
jgi:hypothetical protein